DVERMGNRNLRKEDADQNAPDLLAFHARLSGAHAVKQRRHASQVPDRGNAERSIDQPENILPNRRVDVGEPHNVNVESGQADQVEDGNAVDGRQDAARIAFEPGVSFGKHEIEVQAGDGQEDGAGHEDDVQ